MSAAHVPLGVVARRQRSYFRFIVPALVVIGAVIIFPWLFTLWMSAFDWKIGTESHFVGFDNYTALVHNTPASVKTIKGRTACRRAKAGRRGMDKAPESKKPPDARQRGAAGVRKNGVKKAAQALRLGLAWLGLAWQNDHSPEHCVCIFL